MGDWGDICQRIIKSCTNIGTGGLRVAMHVHVNT